MGVFMDNRRRSSNDSYDNRMKQTEGKDALQENNKINFWEVRDNKIERVNEVIPKVKEDK